MFIIRIHKPSIFCTFQIEHLNIKIHSCGLNLIQRCEINVEKNHCRKTINIGNYAHTKVFFLIVVETTFYACLISFCLISVQNCMQCFNFMKKPSPFHYEK